MWFQTVAVTAAELPLVRCQIMIECFPSSLSMTLLLSNADSAAILYTVFAGHTGGLGLFFFHGRRRVDAE